MGWILFAFVIVIMALEILAGALRGLKLSGIRLAYTAIGTVVAALLAKSLTITIITNIAAANGYTGANLTEIIKNAFAGSDYEAVGTAAAPHIAGLSLSILIPFVFIGLFLVFKLIGLFLYLITKAILKSTEAKKEAAEAAEKAAQNPALVQEVKEADPDAKRIPVYSHITGGVIGGAVGLVACALLMMPLYNLVNVMNNSGVADTIFSAFGIKESAASASAENDTLEAALAKLAYGDVLPAKAADDDDYIFLGMKLSTVKKFLQSTAESPAFVVLQYTGAQKVSEVIIISVSTVKPEDIGAENVETESYNLNEALEEIADIAKPVTELVAAVNENGGITVDSLDKVTEAVNELKDSTFIADQDKLDIVNAAMDVVTESVYASLGIDTSTTEAPSTNYESIDEFTSDVEAITEMSKVLIEVSGGSDGENGESAVVSFDNIDIDALMSDEAKLKEFVSNALSLSNGTEILSTVINNAVSEYSDGRLQNVITKETLDAVGKDKILEVTNSLAKFTKYDKNTVLTDEIKAEISDAIDEVLASGLITESQASDMRKEFKLD